MHELKRDDAKPLGVGWLGLVFGTDEIGVKKKRVRIEKTESNRNDYLTKVAGSERQRGLDFDELFPKVLGVNQECCIPPLDRSEVEKICKGIERYPKGEPQVQETQIKPDKSDAKAQAKTLVIGDTKAWIRCLGHRNGEYFYTSSTNAEIVKIGKGSHNQNNLFDLMPKAFWRQHFSTKNGIGWGSVASVLMASCRKRKQYSEWNHRGRGAWKHKGETVFNSGSSICHLSTGQSEELGRIDSSHLFTVSKSVRTPLRQVPTPHQPEKLAELCSKLSWKNPNHAKLFSGWIAIAPLCGALSWRPHIWLTGPKGTGKSTILDLILQPTLGERALFAQGETSAAGLRQHAKCDAMPIVFDEAETSDRKSAYRIRAVVEYFRQCSSDSDAMVLKGTADGTGMQFKPSNMGCLSSIKVGLDSEQDVSRFCELELLVPQSDEWPQLRTEIGNVLNDEYGFNLFSYICGEWSYMIKKIASVEDEIADVVKDRRVAQQFAPLLVGYMALVGQSKVDIFDFESFGVMAKKDDEQSDSDEGLATFFGLTVGYDDGDKARKSTLRHLVRLAQKARSSAIVTQCYDSDLELLGLKIVSLKNEEDVEELFLFVRSVNPGLDRLLRDTKWPSAKMLNGTLRRVEGVSVHRFSEGGKRVQGVVLPFYLISTT